LSANLFYAIVPGKRKRFPDKNCQANMKKNKIIFSKKRRKRLVGRPGWMVIFLLAAVVLTASFWPGSGPERPPGQEEGPALQLSSPNLFTKPVKLVAPPETLETPKPDHIHSYAIQPGDSLSAIFDRLDLGHNTMYQILAADESLLALDILRPGNDLTFRLDKEARHLEEMELFIHPGNRVIYRRVDDTAFDYEEIIIPGIWEQQMLAGEINGSFYLSAKEAGLAKGEIAQVTDLFKEQLNFAREIRAGDRFQVIRSQQLVSGEMTGQSRIEGIRILRRNRIHSAFLCEDGNYYDQDGDSLMRAFLRHPTEKRFRISSSFNPARLHPVTKRVSPHNGVDFATPIGTPVIATGDGVVTRAMSHPFAGNYIEIQHGGQYVTRYLHLHRMLVKRGESVRRGQRIALSGNTGRSTGPHLHFEFHVRGRPVNPLTADIPLTASVPEDSLAQFNQRVAELVGIMEQSKQQIALR
jgi:murein DD-endopeptidase